jgi:pullulanase/glycogen debranching enzyme
MGEKATKENESHTLAVLQHRRSTRAAGFGVREMVKAFHRARIEVVLDIVLNHTAEGDELGPTFSLRGIENSIFYTLEEDGPRY